MAAAEVLAALHQVKHAAFLERLDPLKRRAVGAEGAGAGGNHHGAGGGPHPGGILDDEALGLGGGFEPDYRMPEMKHRRERRRLLAEPLDQLGGVNPRITRDVVNRLFRVKRGALATRRR